MARRATRQGGRADAFAALSVRRRLQREEGFAIRQLIETRPAVERAVLVAAGRDGSQARLDEHLNELARLADTAGAVVVGRLTQRLQAPTPNYYIGAGKVAALGDVAREAGGTLVVFDDELTPAQGKNLESALGVRVMDRAELILDIFVRRARTREARLQVELAQLEYLLPRLARMWVHLSRIRGGIGLRGPGETQIETDRRLIRRRIARLKRDLEGVARHRGVLRQGRGRRPVSSVALVGYTNAGKSSLLRALTGARTLVDDRLFATLDTLAREIPLHGDGAALSSPLARRIRLVDTVGFIRKLPHHLVASFRATLEEARDADLLLHVIDASHLDWEEQAGVVDRVLSDLGLHGTPLVHVFNKMDLVSEPEAFRSHASHAFEPSAFVSATRGATEELLSLLRERRAGLRSCR